MELREENVSTNIKLAGAWATLITLYIYADFLSLYRPGQIEEVARGVMGPVDVSQATLQLASLIVIIPALMIILSLLLPRRVNRSVNLVLAGIYTLVNVSNLIGEGWAYYLLFGALEIAVTVLMLFMAWKWQSEVDPTPLR
jgi:Family of unknown function (DUF6326)